MGDSARYLPHPATREARDSLVHWLADEAQWQATGSRDFGRGFAAAIRTLRDAPVQCDTCSIPRGDPGELVTCPACGALWRLALFGATWVPGGLPVSMILDYGDRA